MNTIAPPATIPLSAPHLLVRFQNSEQSIIGPNDAPKPAHAKDTMLNTDELGSQARITATTEIIISVTLAITIAIAFEVLILNRPPMMFSETPEEAVRSWLSAVLIVDARIPARITPAISANTAPFSASRLEILMMIVSLSARLSIAPLFVIARPTKPINTATAREITTQTVATLLDVFNCLLSLIAINLRRICGIPK